MGLVRSIQNGRTIGRCEMKSGERPWFKIGVSGARRLDGAVLESLRGTLGLSLRWVRACVESVSSTASSTESLTPWLWMISPLAEGADRLAAEAALDAGFALQVPLPFEQTEYEKDFPATVPAFRALLKQAYAPAIVLPGRRGDAETLSYEAVGRWVVDQCQLLFAVWDGAPSRGRGGTAEIVDYAARLGRPIWWLPADGGAPCLIDGIEQLQARDRAERGDTARAQLEACVQRLLREASAPPAPPAPLAPLAPPTESN
jgi:hypothetical protein